MHTESKVITPRPIQEIEDQDVCLHKTIINQVFMLVAEAKDTQRFIECSIYLMPKETRKGVL